MKKKIILLSLFLLIGQVMFGQLGNNELNREDIKGFAKQAEKRISRLGKRLKILARATGKVRKNIIEAQTRDFADKAKFQIGSNVNGETKVTREYFVKEYLESLSKYRKRGEILNIEFISINVDSELKKDPIKKNRYYFEYSFTQVFERCKKSIKKNNEDFTKNSKYCYKDKTRKGGKIFLEKRTTILGNKWKLFFGNVLVQDVTLLE